MCTSATQEAETILRSHKRDYTPGEKDYIRRHICCVQDKSGMYVRVTNQSDSKHALVDVGDTCI